VSPVHSFAPTAAGYRPTSFAALSTCATVGSAITVLLAAEFPAVQIFIHTNSGVNTRICLIICGVGLIFYNFGICFCFGGSLGIGFCFVGRCSSVYACFLKI
jgi:hypothetical protein